MAIQYVVLAVWVAAIVWLQVLRVEVRAALAFGVISSVVIWFFVDPRRTWWGPGPRSVMADPTAFRQYQGRMNVALVIALVFVVVLSIVVVPLLL
jgi:hypothetical protein